MYKIGRAVVGFCNLEWNDSEQQRTEDRKSGGNTQPERNVDRMFSAGGVSDLQLALELHW